MQRWGDELDVPGGVVLLRKDAIGRCLIAVLAGSVTATSGPRRPVDRISAGGWIGDRAILALAPEPATVVTETPCRLFMLGPRPAMSFAVDMTGMRAALYPSLDEPATKERVRALRAEGLAEWRQLGRQMPSLPVDTPLPDWFQVYRTRIPRDVTGELLPVNGQSPEATSPELRRLKHPRRVAAIAATGALAVLGAVASSVQVPYYSMRGSTRSAIDAVHLNGSSSSEQAGLILFPVVDVSRVTAFVALRDWHDGEADLYTTKEVFGGQSASDVGRANRQRMAEAKDNAVAAVQELLQDVPLERRAVKIESDDIGGPSAGLAFALALIDESTRGDLTGGVAIAATGELHPDGAVRAVGGIRLKTLAARRDGCGLFIVPVANLEEARRAAGNMRLLGVDSLAEAVQKLVADGGVFELPRPARSSDDY